MQLQSFTSASSLRSTPPSPASRCTYQTPSQPAARARASPATAGTRARRRARLASCKPRIHLKFQSSLNMPHHLRVWRSTRCKNVFLRRRCGLMMIRSSSNVASYTSLPVARLQTSRFRSLGSQIIGTTRRSLPATPATACLPTGGTSHMFTENDEIITTSDIATHNRIIGTVLRLFIYARPFSIIFYNHSIFSNPPTHTHSSSLDTPAGAVLFPGHAVRAP